VAFRIPFLPLRLVLKLPGSDVWVAEAEGAFEVVFRVLTFSRSALLRSKKGVPRGYLVVWFHFASPPSDRRRRSVRVLGSLLVYRDFS